MWNNHALLSTARRRQNPVFSLLAAALVRWGPAIQRCHATDRASLVCSCAHYNTPDLRVRVQGRHAALPMAGSQKQIQGSTRSWHTCEPSGPCLNAFLMRHCLLNGALARPLISSIACYLSLKGFRGPTGHWGIGFRPSVRPRIQPAVLRHRLSLRAVSMALAPCGLPRPGSAAPTNGRLAGLSTHASADKHVGWHGMQLCLNHYVSHAGCRLRWP